MSLLNNAAPSFTRMEPASYAAAPEPKVNGISPPAEDTSISTNQQYKENNIDASSSSSGSDSKNPVFSHAKLSYFEIDKLKPKGPRKNADNGNPHDATRELVSIGETLSTGSWWCSKGGWPSPAQRVSTEVFFVLSGRGCVTDTDGQPHEFKAGDTVVLPKGWSGRWDVLEDLHKIWFVNKHERIEDTGYPMRAIVTPYDDLAPEFLTQQGLMPEAVHGEPRTNK
ncbi:hypothetical protein MPSEU_000508100 [Mayamaea pseudoterrestris]|nr:hypothetical protein MPSEU_000508100 [Mayamaea pseudoterrestris]